jgi:hypothetical protein
MHEVPELALDSDALNPPLDTAAKRALIEAELRKDPNRSDRKIADAVGHKIDHKTVGSWRAKLGLATPLGNSPPPNMEAPDIVRTVAVALTKAGLDPSDPTLFPILTAAANREERKFNPFDPKDDCLVAPERLGLACFVNTRNNVVIANGNERDGIDEMVQVNPLDLDTLISRLREIASEFRDGIYAEDVAEASQ